MAEGGGIKYTYEYDICGRIKAKKACGRTLVSYTYDLNGNKKSVTDATGKSTCYEYDISNRLLRISECDRVLAEYVYTLGGKVSRIVCGDIVTGYEYDADGRYAGIRVSVGENVISDIRYGYDDKGNCIKKANVADGINAITEYRYDGIGKITGVTGPDISESYAYDRAGNRVSHMTDKGIMESYRYNEVNELLSVGCSRDNGEVNEVREFTYDADGNMTSDGRGIYKYDSMNRMTEAVMEDGRKLICRYDAEGLRHETEENGRLVASDSEQARTYYHYACDSLGSVSHVIAGDEFGSEEQNADIGRRVLCRYEYDAFGNTVSAEENVTNRYGFVGEMHDGITGQYYLRARYYVPEIGRFTQADTYHGDGLNLYVYARNNPVKYVDPSGHNSKGNDVPPSSESGNYSGLRDLMTPEEVAEYDKYWLNVADEISNRCIDEIILFIKNGGIRRQNGKIYEPSKVSCAVDLNNGNTYIGYSGKRGMNPSKPENGVLEVELQKLVDYTKEVAANTPDNPYALRNSFYSYPVDNCAEIFAVNNSLKGGANINNIFINTKHFWSEEYAPLCDNCKITLKGFKTPNSLKGE